MPIISTIKLSTIKRPNTFLGNLKTKEELVRDALAQNIAPAQQEQVKWLSSEEIINLRAGGVAPTSYANTIFNAFEVPDEIPYASNSQL